MAEPKPDLVEKLLAAARERYRAIHPLEAEADTVRKAVAFYRENIWPFQRARK